MIINLFSKNIKICSYFDLNNSFLKHFLSQSENFDEIVYLKKYTGVSKFDEKRKVIYVNEADNAYRILIYALRSFYALDYKDGLLLHASAISKDGRRAILFVGPPASGKTTILTNALRNGYYYIAEDLLFVNDEFCSLSAPFKVLEIEKITKKAKIETIYFVSFKYGAKFVKIALSGDEKKRLLFESLFNTKALSFQFETFKNLLKLPSYYVMYSNCKNLLDII